MSSYLGLDIGTTFIKAATLNLEEGAIGDVSRRPAPGFVEGLPPEFREVDPGAICAAVEDLLPARCDGIVLCGQMHGFLLVDEGGAPVSNFVCWLDQRVTAGEFAELAAEVTESERLLLGNELRPGIALPALWWMKRHGMLPQRPCTPVSIADFVAARLCGAPPVMVPTQAAAFGALRLDTMDWHTGLLARLGLDGLHWPRVARAGTQVGTWRGAPCYSAVGDQQCALAGALLSPGELSVNIGTGSQVAVLSAVPGGAECQTRPYFDGRYLRTITHIPGGRALAALVGLFTSLGDIPEDDAWRRIEAAVAEVPETDVRAGTAFYPGPCGDRGFLENLHERNLTPGHIFRAVFESMGRNYAACAQRLAPGSAVERAVFSGGVARRVAALRDAAAAALGLPHRLSPHPEDTLFGLLVLARAFSGRDSGVAAATRAVRQVATARFIR